MLPEGEHSLRFHYDNISNLLTVSEIILKTEYLMK